MFNSSTEETIKQIPQIGEIDTERLPQELTRIFALIVGLRRQYANGTINYQSPELFSGIALLQTLAYNLETILITNPGHEKKEAIAFVAGTAHSLLHRIQANDAEQSNEHLWPDYISSYISAIILFLIANSQPDAAEIAGDRRSPLRPIGIKARLTRNIRSLARGTLHEITDGSGEKEEILESDISEMAYDRLWEHLNEGIETIARILTGAGAQRNPSEYFGRVSQLSISEENEYSQRSVFAGPFHLARLLSILSDDITQRAVVNVKAPPGIDPILWEQLLQELAKIRPFLWNNHIDAVNTGFLEPGISAVLTFPTGAGKSTLSELKIASCLFSRRNVVYLVPTHALEDQVSRNLQDLFKDFIRPDIEIDGEYTELALLNESPILVMTPERCLTFLNIAPGYFQNVGLVVFDEFHLIHGKGMGKDQRSLDAMLCVLSLFEAAPTADYLLISAMVQNGAEIGQWIGKVTGRECLLFNSTWKPTRQLHGCLVYGEQEINDLIALSQKTKLEGITKAPPAALKRAAMATPYCFFSLRNMWESNNSSDYFRVQMLDQKVLLAVNAYWKITSNRNVVAAKLAVHFANQNLKTLVFSSDPTTANSTCEQIKPHLAENRENFIAFEKKYPERFESLAKELGNIMHSYLYDHTNVVIHHGLLLPNERFLTEQYFKDANGATALVATATLAQGINLPAEIVIIAGDDRYDQAANARESVDAHELLNAAGRAGRAGQSSQGAVIIIPGDVVTIDGNTLSNKWWALKKTFSNSDQCLNIDDPLQYFLDSIQSTAEPLDASQNHFLFRIRSEKYSPGAAKKLLGNSFYAFRAAQKGQQRSFSGQVDALLKRKEPIEKELPASWHQDISLKTGVSPQAISGISEAVDSTGVENILQMSVTSLIEWYFRWLEKNHIYFTSIFPKESTLYMIKKLAHIKEDDNQIQSITQKLPLIKTLLISYVTGTTLEKIERQISPVLTPYIVFARNFTLRLVPELSFSFGLFSMIVQENAIVAGYKKRNLPNTILFLASCIREGFDQVEKLLFKVENRRYSRVECHEKYSQIARR